MEIEQGMARASEEFKKEMLTPPRWLRLSAFSKGILGGVVGMFGTLLIAALCYTAYQDHLKVNAMFTYLNQRAAAEQQQAPRPQPAKPAETPAPEK